MAHPFRIALFDRPVALAGGGFRRQGEFYRAAAQDWRDLSTMTFVLSRQGDPKSYVAPVRVIMHDLAPRQPVFGVATMTSILANTMAARRLMLILLSFFAALALALSTAGVYGVMSCGVSQRMPEIGIRIALGAVIGLMAAALTRLLQSALYGVGTHDPLTFVAVPIVIAGAAFLASDPGDPRGARGSGACDDGPDLSWLRGASRAPR